jgi:hypothetical protein
LWPYYSPKTSSTTLTISNQPHIDRRICGLSTFIRP